MKDMIFFIVIIIFKYSYNKNIHFYSIQGKFILKEYRYIKPNSY